MITIKKIQKSFSKNEVLKGLDLQIGRGVITAILGPNGSGKTTLIKSILGLVIPDDGEILLEGKPVKYQWEYRNRIDYLPQIARFPENLKVRELITMVKDIRKQPAREDTLIKLFGLVPFLDKKLRNLSGGTRQKVNVVLGFMFDSPLIILDEPTVGLDPVAMIHLKELILAEKERGKTIIITTHIMHLVEELADEIVFILEGKIYFRGSLQQMNTMTGEMNLERSIAQILQQDTGIKKNDKVISNNNKTLKHDKNF